MDFRIGFYVFEMRNIMPVSRIELDYFSAVTLLSYPESINRSNENNLLAPWLYGPLGPLAPLITEAHSSLSTAICRHLLSFISLRSFSTSTSHLHLGLPLLLLPSGFLRYCLNCFAHTYHIYTMLLKANH
jgi:hypothetical protein